jgi:hypothetical protein
VAKIIFFFQSRDSFSDVASFIHTCSTFALISDVAKGQKEEQDEKRTTVIGVDTNPAHVERLILFAIKTGRLHTQGAKDVVESILPFGAFRDVTDAPRYFYRRCVKPAWYVEKEGLPSNHNNQLL